MAIRKDLEIRINNNAAVLNVPLFIYELDHGIELYFKLFDYKYKYDKDPDNILNSNDDDILEAYTTIVNPTGYELTQINGELVNDTVKFVIDSKYTDELDEIGTYTLQIHIKCTHSEFTIPPVQFDVLERLKGKKTQTDDSEVDDEITNDTDTFISEDGKLVINWKKGDIISSEKLNAMVEVINDAVDEEYKRQQNEINRNDTFDAKIEECDNTINDIETRFTSLSVSKQQDAEVILSRGNFESLSDRLDYFECSNVYMPISMYKKLDDETYDTERLQRAIDESSTNGKTLLLDEDLVLHRKHGSSKACSILMPSNVIINGNGHTIKVADNTDSHYSAFNCIDSNNLILENIVFDGNRYNVDDDEHMHLLNLQGATNVFVSNCHFREARGDGIVLRKGSVNEACFNVIIDKCVFDSMGRNGLTLGSGFRNIKITRNVFKGNTYAQHIDMEPDSSPNTSGVYIANNYIDGSEGGGTFTLGSMSDDPSYITNIVENNAFIDTEFYLNGASYCKILNNHISITSRSSFYSAPFALRGGINCLDIIGNEIYVHSGYTGDVFNVSYVGDGMPKNVRIQNNNITCYGTGIHVANAQHLTISDNYIQSLYEGDISYSAFKLRPVGGSTDPLSSYDIKITNNTVKNFSTFAFLESVRSSRMDSCMITNNCLYNIKLHGCYSTNGTMLNYADFLYANNILYDKPDTFVTDFRGSTNAYFKTHSGVVEYIYYYDSGEPNGVFDGNKGSICVHVSSGDVYRKTTKSGDLTGWVKQ